MLQLNPNRLDPYIELKGPSLMAHFGHMDAMLWNCLYLIAQTDPEYLMKRAIDPIIRQINGSSHGRRWFIRRRDNELMLGNLLESIRVLIQTGDWVQFLDELRWLQLYRDTLRQWVVEFSSSNVRVQEHLAVWIQRYYKIRGEITESYLPLTASIASIYGFNEDSKADMFQIGTTGLVHATERYNNSGPMTFPSFAKQWIKQRILMAISRQMPMIKVSHSVLEEQSKLNRAERVTGKEDQSARAQRIKTMAASKDVLLVDDIEASAGAPEEEEHLDLTTLPPQIRRAIIIKHDMLNRAKCPYLIRQMAEERLRQELRKTVKAHNGIKAKGDGEWESQAAKEEDSIAGANGADSARAGKTKPTS